MNTIIGMVIHGKGKGAKLGFPTANLSIETAFGTQRGVYAAFVETGGKRYSAVVNIGVHPTLPLGAPSVEAHIIGETLDLYGKTLRVTLVKRIRDERRFASVEELSAQIASDVKSASEICEANNQ